MTDACLAPEEITRLAQRSASIGAPCVCARRSFDAWDSVPVTFPEEALQLVGKVSPPSDLEPTIREYHPQGTHYWSADAPIALHYFPANRSELWQCTHCGRCYLRYTEFGGYYVDKRMRALRPELLNWAAAPD